MIFIDENNDFSDECRYFEDKVFEYLYSNENIYTKSLQEIKNEINKMLELKKVIEKEINEKIKIKILK